MGCAWVGSEGIGRGAVGGDMTDAEFNVEFTR